jgi:hypothetical protein
LAEKIPAIKDPPHFSPPKRESVYWNQKKWIIPDQVEIQSVSASVSASASATNFSNPPPSGGKPVQISPTLFVNPNVGKVGSSPI